jgi:hypothetical protein
MNMDSENQNAGASVGEPEVRCTALVDAERRESELWAEYLLIEKEVGEKIAALRAEMSRAMEAWDKAYRERKRIEVSKASTAIGHPAATTKAGTQQSSLSPSDGPTCSMAELPTNYETWNS